MENKIKKKNSQSANSVDEVSMFQQNQLQYKNGHVDKCMSRIQNIYDNVSISPPKKYEEEKVRHHHNFSPSKNHTSRFFQKNNEKCLETSSPQIMKSKKKVLSHDSSRINLINVEEMHFDTEKRSKSVQQRSFDLCHAQSRVTSPCVEQEEVAPFEANISQREQMNIFSHQLSILEGLQEQLMDHHGSNLEREPTNLNDKIDGNQIQQPQYRSTSEDMMNQLIEEQINSLSDDEILAKLQDLSNHLKSGQDPLFSHQVSNLISEDRQNEVSQRGHLSPIDECEPESSNTTKHNTELLKRSLQRQNGPRNYYDVQVKAFEEANCMMPLRIPNYQKNIASIGEGLAPRDSQSQIKGQVTDQQSISRQFKKRNSSVGTNKRNIEETPIPAAIHTAWDNQKLFDNKFASDLNQLYVNIQQNFPEFKNHTEDSVDICESTVESDYIFTAKQVFQHLNFMYQTAKGFKINDFKLMRSNHKKNGALESGFKASQKDQDLERIMNDRVVAANNMLKFQIQSIQRENEYYQKQIKAFAETSHISPFIEHEFKKVMLDNQLYKNKVERLEKVISDLQQEVPDQLQIQPKRDFSVQVELLQSEQESFETEIAPQLEANGLINSLQNEIQDLRIKLRTQSGLEEEEYARKHQMNMNHELQKLTNAFQNDLSILRAERDTLLDDFNQRGETIKVLNEQILQFTSNVKIEFPLIVKKESMSSEQALSPGLKLNGALNSKSVNLKHQKFSKFITMKNEKKEAEISLDMNDIFNLPFNADHDEQDLSTVQQVFSGRRPQNGNQPKNRSKRSREPPIKKNQPGQTHQNQVSGIFQVQEMSRSQLASVFIADQVIKEFKTLKKEKNKRLERQMSVQKEIEARMEKLKEDKDEQGEVYSILAKDNEDLRLKFTQLLDKFQEYVKQIEEKTSWQKDEHKRVCDDLNGCIEKHLKTNNKLVDEVKLKSGSILQMTSDLKFKEQEIKYLKEHNQKLEMHQDGVEAVIIKSLNDEIQYLKQHYTVEMDILKNENKLLRHKGRSKSYNQTTPLKEAANHRARSAARSNDKNKNYTTDSAYLRLNDGQEDNLSDKENNQLNQSGTQNIGDSGWSSQIARMHLCSRGSQNYQDPRFKNNRQQKGSNNRSNLNVRENNKTFDKRQFIQKKKGVSMDLQRTMDHTIHLGTNNITDLADQSFESQKLAEALLEDVGCGLDQQSLIILPFENLVRSSMDKDELSVAQIAEENYDLLSSVSKSMKKHNHRALHTLQAQHAGSDPEEDRPQLTPKDLEDIAGIFDRIRIFQTKKKMSVSPQVIRMAPKEVEGLDELAGEFDAKLSQIMHKLSLVLVDVLYTNTQKWAEIEQAKYMLYNFCNKKTITFLEKYSQSLTKKESKEINAILNKIKEGLNSCFIKLAKLFYSKKESEWFKKCTNVVQKSRKQFVERFTQQEVSYKERVNRLEQEVSHMYSQVYVDHLNSQVQTQNEQMLKLKDELAGHDEKTTDLNQNIKELQQTIKEKEQAVIEKGLFKDTQEQKLQAAEKEFLGLVREMRHCESRQRESMQAAFNAEEKTKQAREENKMIMNKLLEFEQANKNFEVALNLKTEELAKSSQHNAYLNQELVKKQNDIENLNVEKKKQLDMIIKYSLDGGKASNGTMIINTKTLKKDLLRSMHSGIIDKDRSSLMELKSQLASSCYGARSNQLRTRKKSVGSQLQLKKKFMKSVSPRCQDHHKNLKKSKASKLMKSLDVRRNSDNNVSRRRNQQKLQQVTFGKSYNTIAFDDPVDFNNSGVANIRIDNSTRQHQTGEGNLKLIRVGSQVIEKSISNEQLTTQINENSSQVTPTQTYRQNYIDQQNNLQQNMNSDPELIKKNFNYQQNMQSPPKIGINMPNGHVISMQDCLLSPPQQKKHQIEAGALESLAIAEEQYLFQRDHGSIQCLDSLDINGSLQKRQQQIQKVPRLNLNPHGSDFSFKEAGDKISPALLNTTSNQKQMDISGRSRTQILQGNPIPASFGNTPSKLIDALRLNMPQKKDGIEDDQTQSRGSKSPIVRQSIEYQALNRDSYDQMNPLEKYDEIIKEKELNQSQVEMRERLKQLTDEVRSTDFGNKTHLIDKGEFLVQDSNSRISESNQLQMSHNDRIQPIIQSGRKILAEMLLNQTKNALKHEDRYQLNEILGNIAQIRHAKRVKATVKTPTSEESQIIQRHRQSLAYSGSEDKTVTLPTNRSPILSQNIGQVNSKYTQDVITETLCSQSIDDLEKQEKLLNYDLKLIEKKLNGSCQSKN